jgi:NADH-quinone oxidoreductase subunit N
MIVAALKGPHMDWSALSPLLALFGGATLTLLCGLLRPRFARHVLVPVFAIAALGAAIGLSIWQWHRHADIVAAALRIDGLALALMLLIFVGGIATVLLSWRAAAPVEAAHGEYFSLLLTSIAGMALLVESQNTITLFVAFELLSIPLYVLCATEMRRATSLEAGLKYLIVGSVGAATLLFGCAFVYGSTGELSFDGIAGAASTNDALLVLGLALIIAGLAFKASAAPFHMWTPDVYQGAPTPVTSFMSSATKITALVVTYRLMVTAFPEQESLWTWAFAAIACASLAIGNVAALGQRSVKRLLAYSSVSHAGFMLIAITAASDTGAQSLMYYLIPYAAMSLGAFAVLAARERELGVPVTLQNLSGFGWERPFHGVAMWVFMLGFLGFPLTGGFWGKIYVFAAAYDSGWWWLIVVGVVATMVSAVYYLAVVRAMFLRDSAELQLGPGDAAVAAGGSPPRDLPLATAVGACVVVTVGSFFAVQPLIDVAESAAKSLPF